MADSRTIVIAGGGIAGLTAALCCAQRGFRVEVFEKAKQFDILGSGIQIGPNAYRVFETLGIENQLHNVATSPTGIDLRSAYSGDVLNTVPLSPNVLNKYQAPYLAMHRANLHQILHAACEQNSDVKIHLGHKVDEFIYHQKGVSVSATYNSRIKTVPGKFLIIADGVKSVLRNGFENKDIVNGDPVHSGFCAWRAMLPVDLVPEFIDMDFVHLCMGYKAHAVLYPIAQKRYLNMVFVTNTKSKEITTTHNADINLLRKRLLPSGLFSFGWNTRFDSILTDKIDWSIWPILSAPKSTLWGEYNAVAIGDAAHGMEPFAAQGAGLAVEDAFVLSKLLASHEDVNVIQKKFHATRVRRVNRLRELTKSNVSLYHMNRINGIVRDMGIRFVPKAKLLQKQDWIYRWKPEL